MSTISIVHVDPLYGFTSMCPNELPVVELGVDKFKNYGDTLKSLFNEVLSISDKYKVHKVAKIEQHPEVEWNLGENEYWPVHCVAGTLGGTLIKPLVPSDYDGVFILGTFPSMHPYGAAFHDTTEKISTGFLENLSQNTSENSFIIVAGIAGDYCVKETVRQISESKLIQEKNLKIIVITELCPCVDISYSFYEYREFKNVLLVKNIDEMKRELLNG
jgi:nicotinamidase/pyrazinamidase